MTTRDHRASRRGVGNDALARFAGWGFGELPVCMAKTHLSLPDDASRFGRPRGFTITVREVRLSAGAGYIVVAPDLLSGLGPAPGAAAATGASPDMPMDHGNMQMNANPTGVPFVPVMPGGTAAFPDQGAVTKAVMALPDAQVLGDLDAAQDYGKKLPAATGKTFVAGFCWGGGKSFLYATHRRDLSGAFVFYGTPPPAEAMKTIVAPVYGFYAGNDARVSATVPQATIDMKAAGKVYEQVIYDGAGHGFMRAGEAPDANAANSAARAEAFRRMVKLLGGVR